jgi:osmotically inducible protein OsmC
MPTRNAEAEWKGAVTDGQGTVKLGSGAFEGKYSFKTRFEDGVGTNPEELIGAAHAGCYSMALSAQLGRAGYKPVRIHTKASVHLEKSPDGFAIPRIDLETEAEVPGIEDKVFQEQADAAKKGCPVSKALAGVDIHLNAKLIS